MDTLLHPIDAMPTTTLADVPKPAGPSGREPLIEPHALGAAVGLAVALVVVGIGLGWSSIPIAAVGDVSIGLDPSLGLACLAAGSIAGWLVGPRVLRARG